MAADGLDAELVRSLVRDQFPQWADLPVSPVEDQGWDNRTFRLGDELSVRLPSADGYVPGLIREERTLAVLGGRLSVAVPRVIAAGSPTAAFARPWSVRAWIEGRPLSSVRTSDRVTAIAGVAEAVRELQASDPSEGPWAGSASAYRGCHVSVYGEDVQRSLAGLPEETADACRRLWQAAIATVWELPPVWVHGDLAPGNLLFDDAGRLAALIDFGQTCVGDPACDLGFAWLSCSPQEREQLRNRIDVPDDTWIRGAAWALWKLLISPADDLPRKYGRTREEILTDLMATRIPQH